MVAAAAAAAAVATLDSTLPVGDRLAARKAAQIEGREDDDEEEDNNNNNNNNNIIIRIIRIIIIVLHIFIGLIPPRKVVCRGEMRAARGAAATLGAFSREGSGMSAGGALAMRGARGAAETPAACG